MARPRKKGLDYFTVDTDIWTSRSMMMVMTKHGSKGVAVMMMLMSRMYRNCYYVEWDEQQCKLFTGQCPPDVTEEDVNGTVKTLMETGFLDMEMWNTYGVLTSRNIQDRFFFSKDYRKVATTEWEYVYEDVLRNRTKNYDRLLKNTEENVSKNRKKEFDNLTEICDGFSQEERGFSAENMENMGVFPRKTGFSQEERGFSAENGNDQNFTHKNFICLPPAPPTKAKKRIPSPIIPPLRKRGDEKEEEIITSNTEEMSRYDEIYATLSEPEKEQSDRLKERLEELNVQEGMQKRLQCMSHFGRVGEPIWQVIMQIKTRPSLKVRDMGSYIYACLVKG